MSPTVWTDEEALQHLTQTFDMACRSWPGLMEPYVVRLVEASSDDRKEIMRCGLRETIKERI